MKAILILIVFGTIINLAAKDLKVLMIGNSFSICVGRNLPKLVAHEKKHNIDITSACIGGCPLSLHAKFSAPQPHRQSKSINKLFITAKKPQWEQSLFKKGNKINSFLCFTFFSDEVISKVIQKALY